MEKVMQRIEKFFALGTLGYEHGKNSLEKVISRMNNDGWRVDQIVPLSFCPIKYYKENMEVKSIEMTSGIILCSKIE